ncbi:Mth938-like domain-containing protein [Rhodovibrionaceae bacterium A322]
MAALQESAALQGSSIVQQLIESYGAGGFQISGVRHEGSVLLVDGEVLSWPVEDLKEISADNLAPLLSGPADVELVLLGCGEKNQMVPQSLRAIFRDAGMAFDSMDSGNAVKTFNLLANEGRRVAAALIAQP